jgi:hypothetical protein
MPAKKGHKMPSMIGNKNAERWGLRKAKAFFKVALSLSFDLKYDFLGEIAKEMGTYIDIFDYLSIKFPMLQSIKTQIKRNCEANCFSNAKKGKIKEASAIVNLKSNHGWVDRQKVTGEIEFDIKQLSQDQAKELVLKLFKKD